MAGLAAAARARELGASVTLHEKGDRPGGSMLLSSGFVWRYRSFERFRQECPEGDPELQRLVHGRFDEALDWLESLGAPVVDRDTGNPLTVGRRFETQALTDALVRRAGDGLRLGSPLRGLPRDTPLVLATGGFQGDRELVREHVTPQADHLLLRANPWSSGDGLRIGLEAGASLSAGMEEIYGRNMPAPPARVAEDGFVSLAQLYARHARVESLEGRQFEPATWSEIDVLQWAARQPRARARYVVPDEALGELVRGRTVAEMIDSARAAGAPVERRDGATAVEVVAGITTTLGGLRVDTRAQAADGVFAAGSDAGGVSTGGYMSGLAAALVLGRMAAESALDA
jgi:fumarate reductase flavoprotein subunit